MERALEELHLRQHMMREDFEVFHFRGKQRLSDRAPHFSRLLRMFSFALRSAFVSNRERNLCGGAGDLLLIGPNHVHRPLFIHEDKPYERIVFWLSRMFV